MIPLKFALALSALLFGISPLVAAETKHDLYLAAALNKNYVVGSKFVTVSGIFFRGPDDGKYRPVGLNFPYIYDLAFDPRDPLVYYAASLNGVLMTKDGGETWRIGTGWDMTEAKDVFLDSNAPDHIYLALPDGVAVSRDRGATWIRREKGLPDRGKYTQAIKVDRTRAGRVLAGCESGIYLTEDGADSWRRVLVTKATVTDIRQAPHDPKLWLATTQEDGLQESRDGGLTWRKFENVPSAEALYNVAFDPRNPQRYAVSSWTYGVLVTEDAGKTWNDRNAGLPADHCVYRVGIDPDSGRLLAGVYKEALFVSDDFGHSWKNDGLEGSTIYNFIFVPAGTTSATHTLSP